MLPVIEVLSAKMGVSAGRLDFEDSVLDGEDGHVEGTASQVVDQDMLLSRNLREQGNYTMILIIEARCI